MTNHTRWEAAELVVRAAKLRDNGLLREALELFDGFRMAYDEDRHVWHDRLSKLVNAAENAKK